MLVVYNGDMSLSKLNEVIFNTDSP